MSKIYLLAGALTLVALPAFASGVTTVSSSTKATTTATTMNVDADIVAEITPADRPLFDVDNNGVVTRSEYSARLPQIDKNGNSRIEAVERANFINSLPGNINTRGAAAAQAQADAGGRPTANAATSSHTDNLSVRGSAESALGADRVTITKRQSSLSTSSNLNAEADARIRADAMARPAADVNAAYNNGGVVVKSTTVTGSDGFSSTSVNSNLNAVTPAANVGAGLGLGLNR